MITLVFILSSVSSLAVADIHGDGPIPTHGSGHPSIRQSLHSIIEDALRQNDIPGATVSVSKDSRMIYSYGFGYADLGLSTGNLLPMYYFSRSRIGSNTKVLATMSMMKFLEQSTEDPFDLDTKVYGPEGILFENYWRSDNTAGIRRHRPIIGMSVGQHGRVTTWYVDGTYSEGSSEHLEQYKHKRTFTVPPRQTVNNITALARGGSRNDVYAWYDDGSFSIGRPSDLDAIAYFEAGKQIFGTRFDGYTTANGQSRSHILGIGMSTTDLTTYTWYHDGTVSKGEPANLAARWTSAYTGIGDGRRYKMIGAAYSQNNVVTTWYEDLKAAKGSPTDLTKIRPLYSFERRSVPNAIASRQKFFKNTTIKHLLSHTSGLVKNADFNQTQIKYPLASGQCEIDAHCHRYILSTAKRLFKPGKQYEYSNHGFGVVGLLLQRLTGKRWDRYLHSEILAPLGLQYIEPYGHAPHTYRDSKLYIRDRNGQFQEQPYAVDYNSAGSHTASAHDLVKLLLAIDLNPSRLDILTRGSVLAMEQRHFPDIAKKVGLGWHMFCDDDDQCLGDNSNGVAHVHSGGLPGAVSYIIKFRDYQYPGSSTVFEDAIIAINFNTDAVDDANAVFRELAEKIALVVHSENTGSYDIYTLAVEA